MRKFEHPREELEAVVNWFSYQNEDLSYGMKSMEDCVKLWRYAQKHPELAEFCDQQAGEPGDWTQKHFKAAVGYNPFVRALAA